MRRRLEAEPPEDVAIRRIHDPLRAHAEHPLQHFCRDADIRVACADGPLSPSGAASIVEALQVPAVVPVPLTRPSRSADVSNPVPGDWSFYDVYDGLKSEVVGGGTTAEGLEYWDVRLYGHSDRAGWSNITLASGYPSRSGQVVTLSLYAGVISQASTTDATIRLAMKRRDDLTYLGEALRGGYPLVQPEARQATFTVPALDSDAIAIPYLQIRYGKDEDVDVTIRVSPVKVEQS